MFAVVELEVVMRRSSHLPCQWIGQGPGNCETGQSVGVDRCHYSGDKIAVLVVISYHFHIICHHFA